MHHDDRDGMSARLRAAAAAQVTYREVGATSGTAPPGYRRVHRSVPVGVGAAGLRAAGARLLSWEVHRRAGLDVEATTGTAALGSTVVLRTRVGPLLVAAPCRVVTVVDEPARRGFAYRTLPGHPEVGEELFLLTLDGDGVVRLRIEAFSRPAAWWVALGGPLARRLQDRLTDRYVRALTAPG